MREIDHCQFAKQILDTIFQSEAIRAKPLGHEANVPSKLKKARAMEQNTGWESRRDIFFKQAKFLATYEDNYEYHGDPVRYYPTYQSLNNEELRGYFSWRTKIRKGIFAPASLSFIFLYLYELFNYIGVSSPTDGYEKILEINRKYASSEPKLNFYLKQWLTDYVVYYNMDSALLADEEKSVNNKCIAVIENIKTESQDDVIDAVKQLAPSWLGRSKFYARHYEDMDAVIYRTLLKASDHFAKTCKRSMVEQYFGTMATQHIQPFSTAIFCNPLKRKNYEYRVDDQCIYRCEDGIWSVNRRVVSPRAIRKLSGLLKTIDSIMRVEYGFGHPVQAETSVKWLIAAIREAIAGILAEKKAAEKSRLKIDFAQLASIRADASITRDRLIVDEEVEAPKPIELTQIKPPVNEGEKSEQITLAPEEYRLLQCLLYGRDTNWLKAEGYIVSVLVDAINEKLYDKFGDSVIDDTPLLLEDYIEDLKEMISA